jgi:hypothetical protein
MSRRKRRIGSGEHYAMLPEEVLTSEACRTLPNFAFRVLVATAAGYRGNNNGDLAMTWKIARTFGITSQRHLVKALAILLERDLLQKTRQGGKRPLGPCLYALTWRPIDDLKGKIDSGPTPIASHAWAKWAPIPAEPMVANGTRLFKKSKLTVISGRRN